MPTLKEYFTEFPVLLRLPLRRCKFWTLPISSEPSISLCRSELERSEFDKRNSAIQVKPTIKLAFKQILTYRVLNSSKEQTRSRCYVTKHTANLLTLQIQAVTRHL